MYMMLKGIILLLTIMGYALYYQKKKLPLCFFPIVLVSSVTVAIYAGGLLGVLKLACYVICLPGLLLLITHVSLGRIKRVITDPAVLFAAISIVWLYVITRGTMLSYYDEGTHWYRICKAMHYEGAYPTTPDIIFYTYVPGCATWIYFITRFIGFSVENCFFAQGLINIASVSVLFAALSRFGQTKTTRVGKAMSMLVSAVTGITLCSLGLSTYVLLVDLQIALVALAALVLALSSDERKTLYISLIMTLCFLVLVKNSALLFVALTYVIYCSTRKCPAKRWIAHACSMVAIPVMLFALYSLRAEGIYGGIENAAQSLSIDRMSALGAEKDAGIILQTAALFIRQLVLAELPCVQAVYACFVLLFVFAAGKCLAGDRDGATQVLGQIGRTLLVLLVYCIGLFFTYIFSMSTIEALLLVCFYRYFGTIAVYIVGWTVYFILSHADAKPESIAHACSIVLIFVLLLPTAFSKRYIWGQAYFAPPEAFTSQMWRTFEQHVPQNPHYNENTYLILWNNEEYTGFSERNDRLYFIAGTWLRSNQIQVLSKSDIESGLGQDMLGGLQAYDYLIVLSDMSPVAEQLAPYQDVADFSVGVHRVAD